MKKLGLLVSLLLFAAVGFWMSFSPQHEEPVSAALAKRAVQVQKSVAFSNRQKEISSSKPSLPLPKAEDFDPVDRCLRRLAAEAEKSGEPDHLLEKLGVGFWLTSKMEVIP